MTMLPEALRDLKKWLSLTGDEQDKIISELAATLGPEYAHRRTTAYVDDVSFRIPTYEHVPSGLEFNLVIGGRFSMGLSMAEEQASLNIAPDLSPYVNTMRPVHAVTVQPFLITRFPVLESLAYKRIQLDPDVFRPDFMNEEGDEVPIYLLREELEALQKQLGFNLPSEAQWEYACRGGTETLFYFGDSFPDEETLDTEILLSIFNDEDSNTKAANPFGLVGLHIGEWCEDSFRDDYSDASDSDLPVKDGPPYVVRGGAATFWPWQSGDEWILCASAMRRSSETLEDGTCGARFVKSLLF
jgi:formylglycine-generating enzyme required for sulfatase activity